MLRVWSAWVCVGVLGSSAGCFSESGSDSGDDDGSTGNGSATATATVDPSAPTMTDPTSESGTASVADSSEGSSGDPSSGSTDGGDPCPVGQAPNPPLPAGWEGPFVLLEGAAGPPDECPEGLTLPTSPRLRSSPSAECSCRCDAACVVLGFAAGTDCGEDPVMPFSVGLDCLGDVPGLALRFDGLADPKPCSQPTPTMPAMVQWEQHGICAGDQNSACVPMPAASVGPCIRSDGDVACPDGLSRKIVGGQEATAECGKCDDCNAEATAACADAEVGGYGNGQCLGGGTTLPVGECVPAGIEYLRAGFEPPECTPAAAMTTIVDPVTYCCADPA